MKDKLLTYIDFLLRFLLRFAENQSINNKPSSLLLGVVMGETAEGRFLLRTGVTKSFSMVGWFLSKTGLVDLGVFGSGVFAFIDISVKRKR